VLRHEGDNVDPAVIWRIVARDVGWHTPPH